MRKALTLVTAFALAFGATTATWAGTAAATDRAHGRSPNGSRASGAVVVDWNEELLRIVRMPGVQPATVHATRNFAILQAAIYDAVVSRGIRDRVTAARRRALTRAFIVISATSSCNPRPYLSRSFAHAFT